MAQKIITETDLKNIIASKIMEAMSKGSNANAYNTLLNAYNEISKITESGFIPFASPAPSSTESRLKKTILTVLDNLQAALYYCKELHYEPKGEEVNYPIMESFFDGGLSSYEEKKENKSSQKQEKNNEETEEETERRDQVEQFFSNPGVNVAQYAYKLYNIEIKEGDDTNEMKNARSLFMKCLNHETNESGYPYSFTPSEINNLYSIISSNQLAESIEKAVRKAIKRIK